MSGYALSPAAQADLESIWDYTVTHWGETKAEEYTRNIQAACEALSEGKLDQSIGRGPSQRIPQSLGRIARPQGLTETVVAVSLESWHLTLRRLQALKPMHGA